MLKKLLAAALLVSAVAGCGSTSAATNPADDKVDVRLGYFPNLTHASAIVGVDKGIFAEKLGAKNALKTSTFNAGPAAVEALFSNALDLAYVGPNPTVNAYIKSKGTAVTVISGSASGGVALVVKPAITGPEQLKGKKIATPQLGNTQDVALRYWLKQHNLTATKEGGGDVNVIPQENSVTVDAFNANAIDGAWVPEPFASKLVAAGGKVLVDERDLWPDKRFVITNLIVRTEFLKAHRDVVKRIVEGQVAANEFVNTHPEEAQKAISEGIGKLTGKPLDLKQIAAAWKTLEFTNDPISSSLIDGAKHAEAVGLLDKTDIKGLYDLSLLNEVLAAQGKPKVAQ